MSKKILIGPAEEDIRALLSQSREPSEVIKTIQKEYGLDLLGIEHMYPLLDFCGYSRLDIHKACLDALNIETVKYIESSSFQLEQFYDLFDKTFPYIHIPLMQPIPMALLKKFERHVGEDVIEKLKSDMNVFANCPLNIKQRVYKQDEAFFQQSMLPLLNSYHHDETLQKLAINLKPDSYQEVIEQRRTHPIVYKFMEVIGGDPQIYLMFMQMVRIVFETTPYPSLCSLRIDVLMNYHDLGYEKTLQLDKCHQLIWSLDTCVRNQNMDESIIVKIKECFDLVKNGTPLYADFAMVLMDPMISNFLASCIVKWLRSSVDDNAPDDLEELISYTTKLLNLAEHAPTAVALNTKIPKLNKEIKNVLWTVLCEIFVNEDADMKIQIKESDFNALQGMLVRSDIARKVFVHYLIDRVQERDVGTLHRCLPLIIQTWPSPDFDERGIVYRQTYISFIRTMIEIVTKRNLYELIADVRWRQVIMENFLLKVVAWDEKIHEQLVWLLTDYFTDPKLLLKLGSQFILISEWADVVVSNGKVDEKTRNHLVEMYLHLISRARNVLNGEFTISPPAVIRFCTSHVV
ncbi:hypothetical protein G6F46_007688 [Rhizopus delemar]|uniref:Negative elongation factor B n=2 Tax=Rhizopus TaxID=4842 RepID=A0A9P6Z067_9FUNG|nr:hypothetical protein G6F55_006588 [Rhizopus delemar]KAG1541353.1 hypothetical protein G6F51_007953 [Rhizopus arrhizus]KAG1495488.1 hypothetical protein G6F54_007132 [Rhizopus delemar]KAG1511646.1 hypothetical protein G6F53_005787 [Rhizopus delemar]KAG1523789.1 hypothetical protein G6F52_004737 [Rhizopus delemar]